MSLSPVEIFLKNETVPGFIKEIQQRDGDFIFEKQDMEELCSAYFDRYPDSFHHRKTDEVLMGYEIVRTCILEKALEGLDRDIKTCCRSMIKNISSIDQWIKSCVERQGYNEAQRIYSTIFKRIDEMKLIIDDLPLGMIKERFIGGITLFYNISYIISGSMTKYKHV